MRFKSEKKKSYNFVKTKLNALERLEKVNS